MVSRFMVILLTLWPRYMWANDLTCETMQVLSQDRDYFNQLLKRHQESPDGHPIATEIGLSSKSPARIDSWEVLDTSWENSIAPSQLRDAVSREIDLVSWESFQTEFQASIAKFKTKISGEPYALFVPAPEFSLQGSVKSNHYFSAKAMIEGGLRPRDVVTNVQDLGDIKNLVLVDDGSFSGTQIKVYLSNLFGILPKNSNINVHLVVPFVSKKAKARVGEMNYPSITWYDTKLIRVAEDIEWPYDYRFQINMALHLTVFEHKIPDRLSTFPIKVRTIDGNWYTNAPYKINSDPNAWLNAGSSDSPRLYFPEYKEEANFVPLSELMGMVNTKERPGL